MNYIVLQIDTVHLNDFKTFKKIKLLILQFYTVSCNKFNFVFAIDEVDFKPENKGIYKNISKNKLPNLRVHCKHEAALQLQQRLD